MNACKKNKMEFKLTDTATQLQVIIGKLYDERVELERPRTELMARTKVETIMLSLDSIK